MRKKRFMSRAVRGPSRLHRPATGRRSEPRPAGGHSNGARGTPRPIDTTKLWGHGTHPPFVRGHRHQRKQRSARRFIVPEGPETPSSMSRRPKTRARMRGQVAVARSTAPPGQVPPRPRQRGAAIVASRLRAALVVRTGIFMAIAVSRSGPF